MQEDNDFDNFYHQYRNLMFYAARQILHDDFLAEDAVAEACYKIYQNFSRWFQQDHNRAKNLAVLVTKNCAIDILRKNNKAEFVELTEIQKIMEPPDDMICTKLELDAVYRCISRLKEPERIILLLRCVHELSEKETAQLLGLHPRTVSMRLYRARQHLKKELRKEGIDYE